MRWKLQLGVIAAILAIVGRADAETYYVAVNNKTGRCQIIVKQPDGKRITQVGQRTYTTKKDAAAAMKSACAK